MNSVHEAVEQLNIKTIVEKIILINNANSKVYYHLGCIGHSLRQKI